MEIVLKGADFSESGIPVPHEIVLTDGQFYSTINGALTNSASRCCDLGAIPMNNNVLKNNGENAILVFITFYSTKGTAGDGNYIGYGTVNSDTYVAIAAGDSIRIDQLSYKDGSGQATSIDSAVCWRLGVNSLSSNVDAELEIV